MTHALFRHRAAQAADELPVFRVRQLTDRRALDAALSEDRAYAAYALGHLEDGPFEQSRFWVAEGPAGPGVVLHGRGALGRTLCVAGDATAIDAILRLHPGPRRCYLGTAAPEHIEVLARHYRLSSTARMRRMEVTAATFEAPAGASAYPVRRLRSKDAPALNRLYASDGGPTGYSGAHIERAVYYGAFDGSRLVAAAGTHIVAPSAGVAVVGNVLTLPAYRGRGLAEAVTGRVTQDLLEQYGCALVALTVEPPNAPAVRAYMRLGYRSGAEVAEAHARRRDHLGIRAAWRRWSARRAGGGEAGEEELATGRPPSGEGGVG